MNIKINNVNIKLNNVDKKLDTIYAQVAHNTEQEVRLEEHDTDIKLLKKLCLISSH